MKYINVEELEEYVMEESLAVAKAMIAIDTVLFGVGLVLSIVLSDLNFAFIGSVAAVLVNVSLGLLIRYALDGIETIEQFSEPKTIKH